MNIKKIGHCCLIIKTGSVTIMTDPGVFSTAQNEVTGIDIVLITHDHQDHFHIDSLKAVLAKNPTAKVICNATVGKKLDEEKIAFVLVGEGEKNEEHGALIEGYGHAHAVIYKEWGQTENTGYFVDGKLFYPGDALTNPSRPVEILALPAAGPWMKTSEALEYALAVMPKKAFPVHDAIMAPGFIGFLHQMFGGVLEKEGIEFVPMTAGEEKEF